MPFANRLIEQVFVSTDGLDLFDDKPFDLAWTADGDEHSELPARVASDSPMTK
ncbi:MAG: hypothetical protein R3C05_23745 [Pirellulaceae bacterium]